MFPDGRYLLIRVQAGWAKNDLFIQDLARMVAVQPLITGLDGHFTPQFAGDSLIVETDWQSPRKRIIKIDLRDPKPEKWKELVPTTDDAIQSFSVIGGKLFVTLPAQRYFAHCDFLAPGQASGRGGLAVIRLGQHLRPPGE